jgi:hypothetical protein
MAAKTDNKNALKHGGAGATQALTHGDPFKGIALEEQRRAEVQLETEGRLAMITETALRLQAAGNLYWNAVCKAAEAGDLEALDRYIARYGWLAGCSVRAWAEVERAERAQGKHDGQPKVIEQYREVHNA